MSLLRTDQILEFYFTADDLSRIGSDANQCLIGGRGFHRPDHERLQKLYEDNVVGLIGNYCLSRWWSGSDEPYNVLRDEQNKSPFKGDGGQDLPGCQVDVKCSLMKGSSDPLNYRLFVNEVARKKGSTYVLALIDSDSLESMRDTLKAGQLIRVFLVGWIEEKNIPHVMNVGRSYEVGAKELLPMIPLPFAKAA